MDRFEVGFIVFFGSIIAIIAVVGGWAIYDDAHAEKFALRKDSWVCTASHRQSRYIQAGKVPVIAVETVCDQWTSR